MYTEEKGGCMQKQQRLSFDMDVHDHKYLKICCAQLGVSIKDFIIKSTLEAVYRQEDLWFTQIGQTTQDVIEENFTLIDHEGKLHDL